MDCLNDEGRNDSRRRSLTDRRETEIAKQEEFKGP